MLRAAALVSAALAGVIRGIHHGKKVVAISGKSRFCYQKWHKNFQLMVLLGNRTRKWLTLSNKWLKTWLVRVSKFNFEPVLTVPPRVPLLLLLNTKQPHNYLKDSLKKYRKFIRAFDCTASLCETDFQIDSSSDVWEGIYLFKNCEISTWWKLYKAIRKLPSSSY